MALADRLRHSTREEHTRLYSEGTTSSFAAFQTTRSTPGMLVRRSEARTLKNLRMIEHFLARPGG